MKFSFKAIATAVNRNPKRSFLVTLLLALIFMILWGREKSPAAFHIDEIWQYSFSNSYGKGVFVLDTDNFNQWLSPSVFRDYITVQPGQRFSFGKISEAAETDIHPPLSFYALNAVSSFFPNTFSKWYGLGINIACYSLTLCCLFGLSRMLFSSAARSLFATALWAFSLGAIDTVMYIRMYCPLTLFSVASAYFLVKYDKGYGRRNLALVFLAFILGGMTDYIFWIFGFFLTVAFILLRWRQRFSTALVFATVSLGAFVTACVVYPHTIMQFIKKDSFSRQMGDTLGVTDRLLQIIDVNHAVNRLLDYSAEQVLYMSPGTVRVLIIAFFIGLLLTLYVLALVASTRSEAGSTRSVNGSEYEAMTGKTAGRTRTHLAAQTAQDFFMRLKGILTSSYRFIVSDGRPTYIFVAAFLTGYTLAVIFPDFQVWTVRGFFYVYPFFSLLLAAMLLVLHDKVGISKRTLVTLVLLLAMREYFAVRSPFLLEDGYKKLNKRLDGANVILVLDSDESAGRLPSFCVALSRANSVYITVVKDESYRLEVLNALGTSDKRSKTMVLNTLGAPPASNTALSIIGPELLLTHDAELGSALEELGYFMEKKKQWGHVFNWFNLYEMKPLAERPQS